MCKIAVVGGGISGLSVAHLLGTRQSTVVFEKENAPGGLIRCERINGNLFHTCGGHVFNSKNQKVLDWFWARFDRDGEFSKADRNSVVLMDGGLLIPYPIENHMYLFDETTQRAFINDLVTIAQNKKFIPSNFEEFLRGKFGDTLYNIYFQPYNEKVWRRDLGQVPLSWLEGKLPMPSVHEMIYNNINHVKEKSFVHSKFWYEKENGSQYIADRMADGLDIRYGFEVTMIQHDAGKWRIGQEEFDKVVFCGNIKDLPRILVGVDISQYADQIDILEYHGTTAVFCEIDKNPYSWIYQPSREHESHRIICTGNFASSNNGQSIPCDRITATVEFTDEMQEDEIKYNLKRIPLHPKYITHKYNRYTYPIQDANTRSMIQSLKGYLAKKDFYFTGRFADWEYYNMDVAIEAAMRTIEWLS